MTKKELLEILKLYPDEIRIFVSGYENGLQIVETVQEVRISPSKHDDENLFGTHEISTNIKDETAILISRNSDKNGTVLYENPETVEFWKNYSENSN